MDQSVLLMILFQIVLIMLNAIFASAEIAVISMNDMRLAKLVEEGNKRAAKLADLTAQSSKFLSTIQVAITLSGFLGSAFAADNFSGYLVEGFKALGIRGPESVMNTVAVALITVILSYFTLIFGELVPKRIAMRKAEPLALALAGLLSAIAKLFAPIVWLLTVSTNSILRLIGIDPDADDDEVSEESIRMMVDAGSEQGAIDMDEKEFIQNVFEFDDLTAKDIAVHRTEICFLWLEDSMEVWEETIHSNRYTRYPVCGETSDTIIGILNTKDYFRLEDRSRESVLANAVKPAYFIPENIKADVLFNNMRRSRNTMAVVLDEYGGVSGIVTINDLLEQLVGELVDEQPEEEQEIERLNSGIWKIHGSAPLDEVSKALGIEIESENYDTLNGLIIEALGRIPKDGSQFEVDTAGLRIRVMDVQEHQVTAAIVSILPPAQNGEKEAAAGAEQ
ncbi:MAG TPA: HlyC/CorC family transporter [Candidatus Copromonas faecavium]|mgnify:CR=1 FL=1|uniref:HlyC/CorC family transporter n=1 Tax=Candidatus Copromonas faecavium (nom. illeg.) TaxID=2840740 RepID=A0A9D1A3D1_9FIRM|nr:HlyC/CorC family transporter [Candidatus Copromonas faecavium]